MFVPHRGNWILLKNDSKTWLEAYMHQKEQVDLIEEFFIAKTTSKWGNLDVAIEEIATRIEQIPESSLANEEKKPMSTFENYDIQHGLKHKIDYAIQCNLITSATCKKKPIPS